MRTSAPGRARRCLTPADYPREIAEQGRRSVVIAEPATPVHRRARGLDVLRGLTVGWLLVVVFTPTSGLRGHARWFGWDHSDVFFPLFVLLAGMGLALQTRDRVPWGGWSGGSSCCRARAARQRVARGRCRRLAAAR
jgi:hypothetical protein